MIRFISRVSLFIALGFAFLLLISSNQFGQAIPVDLADGPKTPSGQSSTQPVATPLVPRCAQIATLGPRFDLLANACEFALSRQTVPNFVCGATTWRSRNGHRLDVITGDVAYLGDLGDRYTNLAVNGHPMSSHQEAPGGWWSGAVFGLLLTTIFSPATNASFNFEREVNTPSGAAAVFGFHLSSTDNESFYVGNYYPGLLGSIWVDNKSGQLERLETIATELGSGREIESSRQVVSYRSSVKYALVAIPELGNFLAPTSAQVDACIRSGPCFRNVLSFHDCRKFGSQSRIVSNPGP
jgi:hypothetical protein